MFNQIQMINTNYSHEVYPAFDDYTQGKVLNKIQASKTQLVKRTAMTG